MEGSLWVFFSGKFVIKMYENVLKSMAQSRMRYPVFEYITVDINRKARGKR